MRNKHSFSRSSILVSIPALIILACLSIASIFGGRRLTSAIVIILFIVSLFSRLWAFISSLCIVADISSSSRTAFPGDNIAVNLDLENRKPFPLAFLDVIIPLDKNLSLIPDETHAPSQWEIPELIKIGASTSTVGYLRCGAMRWYEKARYCVRFRAEHRGILSLRNWSLLTGDGFGLSESRVYLQCDQTIIVYPKILDVDPTPMSKDIISLDTGIKGMYDDVSIIRSTRNYQEGDNLKHINWRLAARALPLSVNVYERILPKSIHIILDGESYSSPVMHKDELERSISVIASEAIALKSLGMNCYLSLPEARTTGAVCVSPDGGIDEFLSALSIYETKEEKTDETGLHVLRNESLFDIDSILQSASKAGHFFLFTYDAASVDKKLIESIEMLGLTIITSLDTRAAGNHKHILLSSLMKGAGCGRL